MHAQAAARDEILLEVDELKRLVGGLVLENAALRARVALLERAMAEPAETRGGEGDG